MNYIKSGDYYIPDLEAPQSKPIGIYGKMRLKHLKHYRHPYYSTLMITGKLNEHLHDIDAECKEQIAFAMKQAEKSAPDKRENQMAWVGYMNNAKHCVIERLKQELIYN